MDGAWINDLDLSTLTAEQFATFFFDRRAVEGVDAKYKLFLPLQLRSASYSLARTLFSRSRRASGSEFSMSGVISPTESIS